MIKHKVVPINIDSNRDKETIKKMQTIKEEAYHEINTAKNLVNEIKQKHFLLKQIVLNIQKNPILAKNIDLKNIQDFVISLDESISIGKKDIDAEMKEVEKLLKHYSKALEVYPNMIEQLKREHFRLENIKNT